MYWDLEGEVSSFNLQVSIILYEARAIGVYMTTYLLGGYFSKSQSM